MKAKLTLEDGRELPCEIPEEYVVQITTKERSVIAPKVAFDGSLISPMKNCYMLDTGYIYSGLDRIKETCSASESFDWTYFDTKEHAQQFDDRMMALWRIKKWVSENDNGFVPDWNDDTSYKWIISNSKGKIDTDGWCSANFNPDFPHMSSSEIAERCIKECEADLKTYFRTK